MLQKTVTAALKTFLALAISTLLVVVPAGTPARAANIIIAASDSNSQWKSQATVVCDGVADQSEINAYLTAGNTVQLAPGTFVVNNYILPQSNTRLIGQGNSSVIVVQNTAIIVSNVSNVELGSFKITGASYFGASVAIGSGEGNSRSGFYIHDILSTTTGGNGFLVYANSNGSLSDIAFVRCDANSPDGMGFMITGEGTNPRVENVTYYRCSVENAGVAPTRLLASDGISWVTGFDLAEYHDMTVNRVQVIKCSVNGAWEAGYHFELSPTKTNIIVTDSNASNAGLKTGGALFGAGYLIAFANGKDDIVLNNNTASGNRVTATSFGKIADLLMYVESRDNYDVFTPPQDTIFPANSTRVASRVNQGNCSGLVVTNGVYKELFLYSSDGNPVNQQIELGAVYAANDGKAYSFSGTRIVAQFADYAVIRLVRSTTAQPPSVNTTTASSLSPTGATINAALASKGTASVVTVSFEYGLTSSYGSVTAGVPSTLTSAGAFSGSLANLTAGTLYHYRAKAVGDGTAYGGDQTFTTPVPTVALSISTSALANGTAGVAYSQALSAAGGMAPYTWAVAGGTMPAGLSLSPGGVISGTPTSAGGPTSVTFRVTDNVRATATKSISITVIGAAWDVNMDGAVNVLDIILIGQHLGETGAAGWIRQDVNKDGTVNVLDAILVGQHLG